MQTEEAKHETNKNTGSGESLGDKASHVGNVASNKVYISYMLSSATGMSLCCNTATGAYNSVVRRCV